jgi:hypothetical protein
VREDILFPPNCQYMMAAVLSRKGASVGSFVLSRLLEHSTVLMRRRPCVVFERQSGKTYGQIAGVAGRCAAEDQRLSVGLQ